MTIGFRMKGSCISMNRLIWKSRFDALPSFVAPKDWADSYLIAFAQSAGIRLVTLDKAIGHRASDTILLSHT